jgi:hypothetical protein
MVVAIRQLKSSALKKYIGKGKEGGWMEEYSGNRARDTVRRIERGIDGGVD